MTNEIQRIRRNYRIAMEESIEDIIREMDENEQAEAVNDVTPYVDDYIAHNPNPNLSQEDLDMVGDLVIRAFRIRYSDWQRMKFIFPNSKFLPKK